MTLRRRLRVMRATMRTSTAILIMSTAAQTGTLALASVNNAWKLTAALLARAVLAAPQARVAWAANPERAAPLERPVVLRQRARVEERAPRRVALVKSLARLALEARLAPESRAERAAQTLRTLKP